MALISTNAPESTPRAKTRDLNKYIDFFDKNLIQAKPRTSSAKILGTRIRTKKMPIDNELLTEKSWEEKYRRGILALDRGSTDKAIEELKASAKIAARLGQKEPLCHSKLTLADAYRMVKDYDRAADLYREIIDLTSSDKNLRSFWSLAKGALGIMFVSRQNIAGALVEFEAALSVIKQSRSERLPEYIPIIMGLAGVQMELGAYEEADKASRYAYDYAKAVLGPEDTCTIATMELCALCALALGKKGRAEILRCRIRELLRKIKAGGPDKMGMRCLVDDRSMLEKIIFDYAEDDQLVDKPAGTVLSKPSSNVIQFPNQSPQKAAARKTGSKKAPTKPKGSKKSSQERVEELIRQAWQAPEGKRAKLAKQALKLSPNCADAYMILAEETPFLENSIVLLRKAVAAAEQALEPNWKTQHEGHAWLVPEAKPSLRAMAMLAMNLQLKGELDEALELYRLLMKLTPSDNQGVRYQLASCLYEACLGSELEELFKEWADDSSAALLYTKALYLYRKEGKSQRANAALRKAFSANPYVPIFLSDIVEMPENSTGLIGIGDETEAEAYINDCGYLWDNTQGAQTWMADSLEARLQKEFKDKEMIDAVLSVLRLADDIRED